MTVPAEEAKQAKMQNEFICPKLSRSEVSTCHYRNRTVPYTSRIKDGQEIYKIEGRFLITHWWRVRLLPKPAIMTFRIQSLVSRNNLLMTPTLYVLKSSAKELSN